MAVYTSVCVCVCVCVWGYLHGKLCEQHETEVEAESVEGGQHVPRVVLHGTHDDQEGSAEDAHEEEEHYEDEPTGHIQRTVLAVQLAGGMKRE